MKTLLLIGALECALWFTGIALGFEAGQKHPAHVYSVYGRDGLLLDTSTGRLCVPAGWVAPAYGDVPEGYTALAPAGVLPCPR
jgi:hypothetical protein